MFPRRPTIPSSNLSPDTSFDDCFSAVFQILISVCAYHYSRILYYEKVNVMPGYCVIGVSRIPCVMHFHNYKPHKAKFKRRGKP